MRVDWQKAWLSCKEGVHSRGEPQCAQVKHRKKTPWTLHSYQDIQRCKSSTSAIYFLYIYFFTSLLLYVWHLSVKYFYMDNFLYFYSFTSLLLYVCHLIKYFYIDRIWELVSWKTLSLIIFISLKKYVFKTKINVETIPGSGFNSQLLKLFTYTCKYWRHQLRSEIIII